MGSISSDGTSSVGNPISIISFENVSFLPMIFGDNSQSRVLYDLNLY